DRMLPHGDVHVQVTGRPAVAACLALARQPDSVAIVHACRHLHRQCPHLANPAAPGAFAAWLLDRGTGPAARGAGLLNREETLGYAYLTRTAAGLARDRIGSRLGAL